MMSLYINYNGKLLNANDNNISHKNRSFLYGDGIFESIKVLNHKAFNAANHYNRIVFSTKALQIELLPQFTFEYFCKQIERVTKKNNHEAARVRFNIFRQGNGLYKPLNNKMGYLIESKPEANKVFCLNETGLTVDVYPDIKKNYNKLSKLKTCNSLVYILAGQYAINNNLDDCILLNSNNNLVEATSSNIFIVSNNNTLITPSIKEGCVAGTMRNLIISTAKKGGINVKVLPVSIRKALNANEMFLTNASSGIKWVRNFKNVKFDNYTSKLLLKKLNCALSDC